MSVETVTSSQPSSKDKLDRQARKSFDAFQLAESDKKGKLPETSDTVDAITETNMQSPEGTESPKSLFTRAYETVRNTDVVSNFVDHAKIWFNEQYIVDMNSEIKEWEGYKSLEDNKANTLQERLAQSDQGRAKLEAMQKKLGINGSDSVSRKTEHEAIEKQLKIHQDEARRYGEALRKKQEILEGFNTDREISRMNIAENIDKKISTNAETIGGIDGELEKVANLREQGRAKMVELRDAQQQIADFLDNNPKILSSDRADYKTADREINIKLAELEAKERDEASEIERHTAKKTALLAQNKNLQKKIAKKQAGWGVTKKDAQKLSDAEREESFVEETEASIGKNDIVDVNDEELREVINDPRMQERVHTFLQEWEVKQYNDEVYRNVVVNRGSKDQLMLMQAHDFSMQLLEKNNTELDVDALRDFMENLSESNYGDKANQIKILSGKDKVKKHLVNSYNFLHGLFEKLESTTNIKVESNNTVDNSKEDLKAEILQEASVSVADLMDRLNRDFVDEGEEGFLNRFTDDESRKNILEKGTKEQKAITMLLDFLFNFIAGDFKIDSNSKKKPL